MDQSYEEQFEDFDIPELESNGGEKKQNIDEKVKSTRKENDNFKTNEQIEVEDYELNFEDIESKRSNIKQEQVYQYDEELELGIQINKI